MQFKKHASYDKGDHEDLTFVPNHHFPDISEEKEKNNVAVFSEALLGVKPTKDKFVTKISCSRRSPFYIVNNFLFNLIITSLSFTLFAIDPKSAQTRLGGTFTLLLTSFSFKIVTSKSLPTIAYLTSLDKYQLMNIVFLACCCIWHSILSSLIPNDFKYKADKIALICYASIFVLLELMFITFLLISRRKVINLKKKIDDLVSKLETKLLDTEE